MPARRYFEALVLLLAACGFYALAATGRLEAGVVLGFSAAWLLRAAMFWRGARYRLPSRWLAVGVLLYLPLYALDGYFLPGGFLPATLHLVVFTSVLQLYAMRGARDALYLGLLAFLEVLAAGVLTASAVFLLGFVAFLGLLIAAFVAREASAAEARATRTAAVPARGLPASLLRTSLLLAAAVMAAGTVVFFLLPRTSLASWQSPPPATALTGFSDEVSLGEVANLQQTDNVVMHIRVLEAHPPLAPEAVEQVLWRGRGLTDFDGKRWSSTTPPVVFATKYGRLPQISYARTTGPAQLLQYQVTLEPMNSQVLFYPARLLETSTRFAMLAWDAGTETLMGVGRGFSGTSYTGMSDLARPTDEQLRLGAPTPQRPREALEPYLELPDGLDPRIRALARAVTAASGADNIDRMDALTSYLQTNYSYSLVNLPQGEEPLSEFLFDSRAGTCEYFASALAVMARTLGIPTRVVNGFTVGAYNPITGEYIVRGRNAHSWVEALFPSPSPRTGRGRNPGAWVSFDATPPGAEAAATAWPQAAFLLDAVSSFWQEWIVNYDWMRQTSLARSLQFGFGDHGRMRTAGLPSWNAVRSQLAAHLATQMAHWRRALRSPWLWLWVALLLLAACFLANPRLRLWMRYRLLPPRAPGKWTAQRAAFYYRGFEHCLAEAGCAPGPQVTAEELLAGLHGMQDAGPAAPLTRAAAGFVRDYERVRFGAARDNTADWSGVAGLANRLRELRRLCRGRRLSLNPGADSGAALKPTR